MIKLSLEKAENYAAKLTYNAQGLIPVIVQDEQANILMLAYMDAEALKKTLTEGRMWYFSRSRKKYWLKGETSGHYQEVLAVSRDCDADTLLFTVKQTGWACHEDYYSCFHYKLSEDGSEEIVGERLEEEK